MALVYASFSQRKRIGVKTWRRLHWATYGIFAAMVVHGVMSGTDTGRPWALAIYLGAIGTVVMAAAWRILVPPAKPVRRRAITGVEAGGQREPLRDRRHVCRGFNWPTGAGGLLGSGLSGSRAACERRRRSATTPIAAVATRTMNAIGLSATECPFAHLPQARRQRECLERRQVYCRTNREWVEAWGPSDVAYHIASRPSPRARRRLCPRLQAISDCLRIAG